MPAPRINLSSNERVFICGKTGSGKTTLAKFVCQGLQRLLVFDSKGTLDDWDLEPDGAESRGRLEQGENVRIRLQAPLKGETALFWEEAFDFAISAGDVTLYVDELFAIVEPGRRAPDSMQACWTRGREFGIGCLASTQRPSWVPMFTMSESEHNFMFRLNLEKDRQTMSAFLTERVLEPIRDPHGFFYMAAADDEPSYIPDLFGKQTQSNPDTQQGA